MNIQASALFHFFAAPARLSARRFLSLITLVLVAASAQATERGLLWKIEAPTGGAPSYLLGTIHTDDARVNDFSPQLTQALQQTDNFMMEVLPPRDLSIIYLKQGTLRDKLTPAELEQVQQLADEHAIQEDMALRMKPWLLATIFALPHPQSPFTMDVQLFAMAANSGKNVLGLERAEEHFGALDSLSEADQLTLLRITLKQTPQEKEHDFEDVLQAYLGRDADRIAAVDDKRLDGMPEELWQRMKTVLLDQRNERMAERIVTQLKAAPAFIAVGAAHLAGPDGLVARLRKAGYKLTPLE